MRDAFFSYAHLLRKVSILRALIQSFYESHYRSSHYKPQVTPSLLIIHNELVLTNRCYKAHHTVNPYKQILALDDVFSITLQQNHPPSAVTMPRGDRINNSHIDVQFLLIAIKHASIRPYKNHFVEFVVAAFA